MPRKSRFKIIWWKWYLVDVKNWHRPLMVRKFFESEKLAKEFANNYLGDTYEPIRGYEALELNIRDYPNIKKEYRHKLSKTTKYKYPPHIKTSYQKMVFRINEQHKSQRMKNLEPITRKEIFHMLNKRPIEFAIRTKSFERYQWPYSKPSQHLKKYVEAVKWPKYVRTLTVIEKTLIKYNYDTGPWPIHHVVIRVYEEYKSLLDKFTNSLAFVEHTKPNMIKVKEELKARGFVNFSRLKPDTLPDGCYVCEKDGLGWFLVYPQWCRLTSRLSNDDKRPYIYDFSELVGIKGFTKSKIPNKYIS